MKHAIYSPLVLIFFSACADPATAGPRVDGAIRCAMNDLAAVRAPIAEETPTLSAAALETDDFACGTDETLAGAQECGADTAVAAAVTPNPGRAIDLVRRAVAAIQGMLRLPAKYGIALFGGADPVPVLPKVPKKPRMLTLF